MVRIQNSKFRIMNCKVWLVALLLSSFIIHNSALCQQPQAQSGQPLFPVNAKYVNGVAPGYWSTAGTGLTLNISAGTAFCNGAIVTYAGGTLTMAASATNTVYLDPAASCAPAVNTVGLTAGKIPIASVVAVASAITSITDQRGWFAAGQTTALWTPDALVALGAVPVTIAQYKNNYALRVLRVSAYAETAGVGGTLGSQFQITDGTNNCNTGQDMLVAAGTFSSDLPTGTCAFAAAATLSLKLIADDHTAKPASIVFTIEMTPN